MKAWLLSATHLQYEYLIKNQKEYKIKDKCLSYCMPEFHQLPWNEYSSPYSYSVSHIIHRDNVQAYKVRLSCEHNGEPPVMNKIM